MARADREGDERGARSRLRRLIRAGGGGRLGPMRAPRAGSDPMTVSYRVEIEQEADGRYLAEVTDLPGVMAYGATADEALAHAQALALRVLADRLEQAEGPRGPVSVQFETSAAA